LVVHHRERKCADTIGTVIYFFSNKIYRSNFVKQFKKKNNCVIYYNFLQSSHFRSLWLAVCCFWPPLHVYLFTVLCCAAGALYDVTESYSWSFIVAGCLLLLAGVVCIPLRRVARWERRRCKLHRPTTTPVGCRVMNPPTHNSCTAATATWRMSSETLSERSPFPLRDNTHQRSRVHNSVCRYSWHSVGSLGWPFPVLKCRYIFQIKYTEAILSNSTRELLWFEITKMLIAVLGRNYRVIYYNFWHTFFPHCTPVFSSGCLIPCVRT